MKDTQEDHFEHLFRSSPDPWGYDRRWYEKRKRATLLAALPQQTYRHAYEPACGNGALTAELASRCSQVFATDASEAAVQLARSRLTQARHVRIDVEQLPEGEALEAQSFDLIVVSEIGYYLGLGAWRRAAERFSRLLAEDGDLVACHWRGSAPDRHQTSELVHEVLGNLQGLMPFVEHREDSFLLSVWTRRIDPLDMNEEIR